MQEVSLKCKSSEIWLFFEPTWGCWVTETLDNPPANSKSAGSLPAWCSIPEFMGMLVQWRHMHSRLHHTCKQWRRGSIHIWNSCHQPWSIKLKDVKSFVNTQKLYSFVRANIIQIPAHSKRAVVKATSKNWLTVDGRYIIIYIRFQNMDRTLLIKKINQGNRG